MNQISCYVVSGATGYIGSALCRYFDSLGFTVLRLSRSHDPLDFYSVSYDEFLSGQSRKISTLGPCCFIHCAALAHQIVSFSSRHYNYSEIFRVNSLLPLKLAKACVFYGINRFLFLSTVGVHGISSNMPLTEVLV